MFKKIANPFIAVLLTLTMLGATVGIAAAKSDSKNGLDIAVGDKVDMVLKGAGVMTRGQSNIEGILELSRSTALDKEDVVTQTIKWAAPYLNVELKSDEKAVSNNTRLNGNAVIFFNIPKGLDSAAKDGRIAIYKFDETRDMWVRLGTHMMGSTEVFTRAQGSGTYGLGWVK